MHWPSRSLKRGAWTLLTLLAVSGAAGVWLAILARQPDPALQATADGYSAADFSRIVREFSEEDGFFRSDNFTSNETSYLHIVDRLRQMRVSGGAYLGVGPEQNFTYIAKIRPRVAFIVDLRRQAMIQHLMYKALFVISKDRAEFLSNLLSRAGITAADSPGRDSIQQLIAHFESADSTDQAFEANLARIRAVIRQQFRYPLSEWDTEKLAYVYAAFRREGLALSFQSGRSGWWGTVRRYPNLADLILQTDLKGHLGNFLAAEEDYQFLRSLQLENRIIPVVGNFAGPKAFGSVAAHLRRNGLTVRAFYTSNVEQYLFQNGDFGAFVQNVRRLPIDTASVMIRSVPARGWPHPAHIPGHRTTTLLQRISVFLADYDQGAYGSYRDLVTSHFIAGN